MHSRKPYRHPTTAALVSVFFLLVLASHRLNSPHAHLFDSPPLNRVSAISLGDRPAFFICKFSDKSRKRALSFLRSEALCPAGCGTHSGKRRSAYTPYLRTRSVRPSPRLLFSEPASSESPALFQTSPHARNSAPSSAACESPPYTSPQGPVCLASPAKVNLFLKVFPRPPDAAFHPILSLFSFVSLSDYLAVYTLPANNAAVASLSLRVSVNGNGALSSSSPVSGSATLEEPEKAASSASAHSLTRPPSSARSALGASGFPENPFPASSSVLSSLCFPYSCASESGDVLLSTKPLPCSAKDNLILKALTLYREKVAELEGRPTSSERELEPRAPCPHRFLVYLHKNIPVQAGLGGASSNAAAALLAAYALAPPSPQYDAGRGLRNGLGSQVPDGGGKRPSIASQSGTQARDKEGGDTPETRPRQTPPWLVDLGAQLGSDVPFFLLSRGAALCGGRGELVRDFTTEVFAQLAFLSNHTKKTARVTDDKNSFRVSPLSDVGSSPGLYVYVIKPKEGLATKAVYDAFRTEQQLEDSSDNSRTKAPRRPGVCTPAAGLSEALNRLPGALSFPFTSQLHPCFLPALFENDLQAPALRCLPALKALHASVSRYVADRHGPLLHEDAPTTREGTGAERRTSPQAPGPVSGLPSSAGRDGPYEERRGEKEDAGRPALLAGGMTGSGSAFVAIGVDKDEQGLGEEERSRGVCSTRGEIQSWNSFLQSERLRGSQVFRCRFLTKTQEVGKRVPRMPRRRRERSSTDGHEKGDRDESACLWFDLQTDFEQLGEKGWRSVMEKDIDPTATDEAP